MHLTAASWFDFEVEAKPYTFSGGRIGLLPVILLCCAFWGRCPLSPCSKPGRGCCPESPIYRGHPELRELLSLLRVQNGERTSPGPSPASRSPRPFSGGCPPPSGSYEEQANPNASAFDPEVHLAWGVVSIIGDNQVLRVFLEQSNMING